MTENPKHILVAILDWGLGHATRCVPLIETLRSKGHRVSIAGSGRSLELLRKEFPGIEFHQLTPYGVTYSKRSSLLLAVLWHAPRLVNVMIKEHHELKKIIKQHQVNGVISDNRYGCWSADVPSVIITHQLTLLVPGGLFWPGKWLNKYLHRKISRFDACWVPDFPGDNLTGKLSQHPSSKVRFIGMLSRCKPLPDVRVIPDRIVCLVSGPEPQRTVFEELMITELKKTRHEAVLVRGLPEPDQREATEESITRINHLPSREMNTLIQSADIIVCRSGYSTLMDLHALGKKKVIVIPTPGQTEQEYLAARLEEKNIAVVQEQGKINLVLAIEAVKTCLGFETITPPPNLLSQEIDLLLNA